MGTVMMQEAQLLNCEISTYLILSDQLKAQYAEIDEETLADTLEGLSQLPDLIQVIVRSSLEDEALIQALRARLEEMGERLSRFKERKAKKRTLVSWAMEKAGMERIQAPDFSIFMRSNPAHLEISDKEKIPGEFFVPQSPRLDRAGLAAALKRGDPIDGAYLAEGSRAISVRVK
jgi:hypothetical protein